MRYPLKGSRLGIIRILIWGTKSVLKSHAVRAMMKGWHRRSKNQGSTVRI